MISDCFTVRGMGQAVLIAGFVLGAMPSVQAFEATAEQEQACEPDAFRLCSAEIPDTLRVAACMKANEARLSPQCRAAFRSANAEQSEAPLRRRAQSISYMRD